MAKVFLMNSISTAVHRGFIQLSKAANFLFPTDEKRPTDLEKSFSCNSPRIEETRRNYQWDSSIRGKIGRCCPLGNFLNPFWFRLVRLEEF